MIDLDIIFLHGFLGLPADWNNIVEDLKVDFDENKYKVNYHQIDYFKHPQLGPKNSFDKFSVQFMNWIRLNTFASKKILVGYSLGGRLAQRVFFEFPSEFEKLVVVSSHPGLTESQIAERDDRKLIDAQWAEAFLHEEWGPVLERWNMQPVFEGSQIEPERHDTDYRRDLLAKALTNWSLALQPDFRPMIQSIQEKIVWIVGDRDRKYVDIAKQLYQIASNVHFLILPDSGHRVIFDNSHELSRSIHDQIVSRSDT